MKKFIVFLSVFIALVGALRAAPTVTNTNPTPGATLNALTSITVTFSETVGGVQADDLQINGVAADTVSAFVPPTGSTVTPGTIYTFTFTQPVPGTVTVDWDSDNEIVNSSGVSFATPGTWTYTLVDTIPPTVIYKAPSAAGTVNGLTQAEVTFSEPVTGVVAGSLLINNSPATSVTGSAAGKYVFSFSQPANGAVVFKLGLSGQSIVDTANNAFAGLQWTSTLNTAMTVPSVVINEILANNVSLDTKTTMKDEDGDFSPWIEIWNKGSTSVDLLGWTLTNDSSNPGLWTFPSTTIAAGGYLVVWASGKDRTAPASGNYLHTNFTLAAGGDYLALYPPALPRTAAASGFTYPAQRGDVSYGYDPNGVLKYFSPSTFGTANLASTITGIAQPVTFSVGSGFFKYSFNLVLSSADAGTTIRYTTDGTAPTSTNGTVYSSPLAVAASTVIRAGAYSSSLAISEAVQQSYLFPENIYAQPFNPTGYPLQFINKSVTPNVAYTNFNTWTPTPGMIENASRNYFQVDSTNVNDSTTYIDGPGTVGTMRTNKQRFLAGLTGIPTVSIAVPIADLFDQTTGIYSHPTAKTAAALNNASPERAASMEIIYPDGSQSNQQVNCGIQIQGGSSRMPSKGFKHSFRLNFKDDYGSVSKYSHSFFTDSNVSSFKTFVLDGGSNYWEVYDGGSVPADQRQRGQGLRDAFTSDLLNEVGWPSFHSRFANIFINGLYWGLDYIHERSDENWAASYYGGDKDDYNVYRCTSNGFEVVAGDTTYADWKSLFNTYVVPVFTYSGATTPNYSYPALSDPAKTQTKGVAMSNAAYQAIQQVLDVQAFADYMLVNLYTGNDDWPQHNWYVSRKARSNGVAVSGGKFYITVWDAEHTLKSYSTTTEFDNANNGDGSKGGPGSLWIALRTNGEFRQLVADRIQKLFFNGGPLYVNPSSSAYDPAHPENNQPAALYMKRVTEVSDAIAGEYAKWGSYTKFWAPGDGSGAVYSRNGQWMNELNALLGITTGTDTSYTWNYFPRRSAQVLAAFQTVDTYPAPTYAWVPGRYLFPPAGKNAPVFGQFGGRVVPGASITVGVPSGSTSGSTIYYTLDGTDPRAFGGAVATSPNGTAVMLTSGSVTLSTAGTVELKARALYGSTWSALTDATFVVGSPAVPLRITELMYNPVGGSNLEFVELQNMGTQPLDISNYAFIDGIGCPIAPGTTIAAGARLVFANNGSPSAWTAAYPGVTPAGYFTGNLSNSGERITLVDASGRIITSVTYGATAPWPVIPKNGGASIEVINPLGDPNDPSNWQASSASTSSTPGQASSATASTTVEFSEVLAKNTSYPINGNTLPFFKLHNTSAAAVSVAGWKVTNSTSSYLLPSGTSIAAGNFLVILSSSTAATGGAVNTGFDLNSTTGDTLTLYDNSTTPVRKDGITWGQQVANYSIAKASGAWRLSVPNTTGDNTTPASLAPNSALSINEWLTNPSTGSTWFELYNSNATLPAALQGLYAQIPTQLGRFNGLAFIAPAGFIQVFTDSLPGGNHLDFTLPATATTLSLLDSTGTTLTTASLSALSANISQGRFPDGSATLTTFTTSTPAATNAQTVWTGPQWNEVMAIDTLAADGHPGWVELYNPNSTAFNVSGLKVGATSSAATAWTIPANTTIPATGYLALWCDGTQAASTATGSGMNTGFTLNGTSGAVYLFNAAGQPVNQLQWGFQIANKSIGLVSGAWTLLASPTRGSTNSAAAAFGATTNLRVNEWLAATSSSANDWFELYNLSAQPVSLGGLYLTDNPSITEAGEFQIAALSYIAGNGWVKYEADSLPGLGSNHVNFKLSEAGDYVQISANDGNYTAIDGVSFGTQTLNVSQGRIPDGGTIQTGLTPTPGAKNILPPAPTITSQPSSVSVSQGGNASFSVTATGSAPLTYQWYGNGVAISGATSSTVNLTGVTIAQDGYYVCVVTNTAGSLTSNGALLIVKSTYSQWSSYYSLGAKSAANADADGDGITNAQEYFHHLNPNGPLTAADEAALPKASVEAATQSTPQYLTITFRQSVRALPGSAVLQASSDLRTGRTTVTPAVTQTVGYDVVTGDPIVQMKVIAADQKFLRLQITP